jgi:hypothetical protein
MGMRPDVRLETGTFLLEPHRQRIQGRSLYLGITLAQALSKTELESLIQTALSRAAGPHGKWLPEAQDAFQNAADVLQQARVARTNGALKGESDPALEAYAIWLACWSRLMRTFEEEDVAAANERQAAGSLEMERGQAAELIVKAKRAWADKVYARFMLDVSFGQMSLSTQERFNEAMQESGAIQTAEGACWRIGRVLYGELVAKDTAWMASTGQVALMGNSWELQGIHAAQIEDGPRQWDFSLRLNS